jgi:hypothetical protein
MLYEQEDNELSVLIDNTPHDVLVSINKIVFEQLLNDKFVAYFKDFKDDMSSLYAFYISISKDLQVDKNFKTFMRFFINYIDMNDIQVTFQHGSVGYVHRPCVLSLKTLDHFVFALKKRYSKCNRNVLSRDMWDLWRWKHIVFTITSGPKQKWLNTVLVFRDRNVKETVEMMQMEYNRTMKSITRFGKTIQDLPHADEEIGKILQQTHKLKKIMSQFSTIRKVYDLVNEILQFVCCIDRVYEHLWVLHYLLNEYIEDQNPDLLLWMKGDDSAEEIWSRVIFDLMNHA